MRGYFEQGLSGDKIEAFNIEARFSSLIPFYNLNVPVLAIVTQKLRSSLFFDAGRISSRFDKLWDKRFEVDCGFSIGITSLWSILGQIAQSDLFSAVGLNTIRIDFPIYVSAPPPDEHKLKLRWLLGFTQNF